MNRMFYPFAIVAFSVYVVSTAPVAAQLIPRTPLPKPETITKPTFESRLTVKFVEDLKVRAVNGDVVSQAGGDLGNVQVAKAQFALTFQQLIQLPQATLDFLETRAARRSGIAQPDLAGMMVVHGADATIEAAAQALLPLVEIEWAQFVMLNPEPPCVDIPPATPNYFAQSFQDYHGPDPGLDMTCAWVYAARGQGIQIADAEFGYIRDHEDLCNINEPVDQTFDSFLDHGTAVLGEIVGLENAYGITGLVPDATAWFFTEKPAGVTWSPTTRATAIANAIATVAPGDIVLLEMQITQPGASGPGPAELNPDVWTLTRCATDSDIIVVAAAGNGNQNLDGAAYTDYRNRGDSGAIIVGAGTSNTNHDKLSFSTYGQRVNVQGWGHNVFTLGYGGFAQHGGDVRQTYTATFSGTSSASPFVAGAAAALQSLAVPRLGRKLTPAEMRGLLSDEVIMIPQGLGGHIGPFPNMAAAILNLDYGNARGVGCDCNSNAIPDLCDISAGTSLDTNGNGVPDECAMDAQCGMGPDCNVNSVGDVCDICTQTSADCNFNNVPDECDPDCNQNLIPDDCEIPPGTVTALTDTSYACDDSLSRIRRNVLRFQFACPITLPLAGEVEIRELLENGAFEADLSDRFDFTLEGPAGFETILRIEEDGCRDGTCDFAANPSSPVCVDGLDNGADCGQVFVNETWYAVLNSGNWAGVADFQVDYASVYGDADNDHTTLFADLAAIYNELLSNPDAPDDSRFDIDGFGGISFGDIAAAFNFIDSAAPAKPTGHDCPGSSQQSQGGGSGSESSSPAVSTTLGTTESLTTAEDGTPATFVAWFPDFLSELEVPESQTYDSLGELLRQLATWAVENLTKDQRDTVASALSDPSRTFADPIVAARAQEMASAIAP